MTERAPCRRLEWDSTFFGVNIARVDVPALDEAAARSAIVWCEQRDVRCLYYLCPIDAGSMKIAESHGFHAVDVRLVFERALVPPVTPPSEHVRAYAPADREALRAIARNAFSGTRFDTDPGFARPRVQDLYDVWLTRSCEGWAERVLVAVERSVPVGFVTCHEDGGGAWRIGLIGVAADARGRGTGRSLVVGAVATCAGAGARTLTVVTQGQNIGAQRLYQREGFRTSAAHLWYHRWFEARSA
jgi:ribosomal protein S18 acetylase RimI-like enzyme